MIQFREKVFVDSVAVVFTRGYGFHTECERYAVWVVSNSSNAVASGWCCGCRMFYTVGLLMMVIVLRTCNRTLQIINAGVVANRRVVL